MTRHLELADEQYADVVRGILIALGDQLERVAPEIDRLLAPTRGVMASPDSQDVGGMLAELRRHMDALDAMRWPDQPTEARRAPG